MDRSATTHTNVGDTYNRANVDMNLQIEREQAIRARTGCDSSPNRAKRIKVFIRCTIHIYNIYIYYICEFF